MALALLVMGVAGTGVELLLLGHTEDRFQWAPVALLAAGLAAALAAAVRPTRAVIRTLQALMAGYLPAAALGVWLHLRSNAEFELELQPSIGRWELIRETLTGAMPALAPGTMAWLGLLGLLVCWKHPALSPESARIGAAESARGTEVAEEA